MFNLSDINVHYHNIIYAQYYSYCLSSLNACSEHISAIVFLCWGDVKHSFIHSSGKEGNVLFNDALS